jgi:FMN phosphatase YigB (HAD superfamily)
MTGHGQLESIEQLADYLASLGQPMPVAFGERVQRAVVLREAGRLVRRMDAFERGELNWLSLDEAWEVMELARASATMREATCILWCDRLRQIGAAEAERAIGVLLDWVDSAPRNLRASLLLAFDSEMDVTRDPAALRLAVSARVCGWQVAAGAAGEGTDLVRIELRSANCDRVTLAAGESPEGIVCRIQLRSPGADPAAPMADWEGAVHSYREVEVPEEVPRSVASPGAETGEEAVSVTDLFGPQIMLRDIEPRSPALDGIETFREEFGWDETYVPRKNEPEYGQALLRILGGADAAGPERIVYVGDTLLNDGGAIRSLQQHGPRGRVWGFLCGATKTELERDVILDRVYFGSAWSSLAPFFDYSRADGLVLDSGTWVLFDLDQTVYAAKGRDDEPLVRARWDAIRDYLASIVPSYRFDPERAEALYREFDRDEYHPVTRDNLDYVVLLVLAAAAGLADATEIRDYANSERPSIGTLADELRRRAAMRVGHEDVDAVLNAVKAVSFNAARGDATPCKDFRRFECLAMAARMRGDIADGDQARILLNREVVDFISRLRQTPARLFAVSDRPIEAAVVDDSDEDVTDLMTVPMGVRGTRLPEPGTADTERSAGSA